VPFKKESPSVIICNTIKGKGIPFMEDKLESHYIQLTKEDYEKALKAL
jgi:transketolase